MKRIVFINACIRGEQSRTQRLAMSILNELKNDYEITEINLTSVAISPITSKLYNARCTSGVSAQDAAWAQMVANADRIVIAAPFWDMSFPAILKVFLEHISIPDITFKNTISGNTVGNCKAKKILYITTRGMNIETNSPLDQGTSYLKALGWLWGIPEIYTVAAYGMDVNDDKTSEYLLKEALDYGIKICKGF